MRRPRHLPARLRERIRRRQSLLSPPPIVRHLPVVERQCRLLSPPVARNQQRQSRERPFQPFLRAERLPRRNQQQAFLPLDQIVLFLLSHRLGEMTTTRILMIRRLRHLLPPSPLLPSLEDQLRRRHPHQVNLAEPRPFNRR